MPLKKILPAAIAVTALLFITVGDRPTFLPDPVRNASYKTRMFVIGLWPDWLKPKNQNQQREQQIEQLGG